MPKGCQQLVRSCFLGYLGETESDSEKCWDLHIHGSVNVSASEFDLQRFTIDTTTYKNLTPFLAGPARIYLEYILLCRLVIQVPSPGIFKLQRLAKTHLVLYYCGNPSGHLPGYHTIPGMAKTGPFVHSRTRYELCSALTHVCAGTTVLQSDA